MRDPKSINLDDLRRPGMRRISNAIKQIEAEGPGLLDEALIASIERAKSQDGGHMPQ